MCKNKILFLVYPLIASPFLPADVTSIDQLIEFNVKVDSKITEQSLSQRKNIIQKTGLGELTLEGAEQYAAIDLQEGKLILNTPVFYDASSQIKIESNAELALKKDFLMNSPLVRFKSKGKIIADGVLFNNQYEDGTVFLTGIKDASEIVVTKKGIGVQTNSNIDWNLSLRGEGSLIKKGSGLLTITAPIVDLTSIQVKEGSVRFFQNIPTISKILIEKNSSFIAEISKLTEWNTPVIGSGQFIKKGQGTLIFNKTDGTGYEGEVIVQQGRAFFNETSFKKLQIASRARVDFNKIKKLETLDLNTRSTFFLKSIEDDPSNTLKISKLKVQNGACIAIQYDPLLKKRTHPYLQINEIEFNTQGAADKLLIEFRPSTKDTPYLRTLYPLIQFKGNDEFGTIDFVQRLKINPIANYQPIYGEETESMPSSSYIPYTHLYADREKGLIYVRLEDKPSSRPTLHHPSVADQEQIKKEEPKKEPVEEVPLPIDPRFSDGAPIIEFPSELKEALEQMARCDLFDQGRVEQFYKKGENYFDSLDGASAHQYFEQFSFRLNDWSAVDIFKSNTIIDSDAGNRFVEFNRVAYQFNYLKEYYYLNILMNYDFYHGMNFEMNQKINTLFELGVKSKNNCLINGEFVLTADNKIGQVGTGLSFDLSNTDYKTDFKIIYKNNLLNDFDLYGVGINYKKNNKNSLFNISLDTHFCSQYRKKQVNLSFMLNIK